MKSSTLEAGISCIGLILLVLVVAIFEPLLFALGGYIMGWVLKTLFPFAGNWLIVGAQAFGLEITLAQLPMVGAFLAFVGAFFHSHLTNRSK